MKIPKPTPPIQIPSAKKDLALLLAGGVIVGGKYLWKKWQEKNAMKSQQKYPGQGPVSDEPSPFGTMESKSGKEISLKSVSLTGSVEGLLFSSTISQEYRNETDEALEIIYTFPVGYNTTLLGMDATIGEKKLHGEVVKKAEAEEKYEEAIDKGDSAIMVQESSMGLYTANLSNIKPGESVTVEINCAKLLNYDQGQIRIAIPTVIGERYGDEHCAGGLAFHETARPDKNAKYAFSLALTLKGEIATGNVSCPTHQAQMEKKGNDLTVKLDSGAFMDRDFVLLVKGLAGTSRALCVQDEDKWMACASFCPKMDNVEDNPLALKILVDCSGSMSGMSIKQAQKGLQKILNILSPKDNVSYSRFGSDVDHLTKAMLECSPANMQKLLAAIDATDSDMGGTEMEKAVLSTVKDIANSGDLPPVMLLITDGDIWEAKSLIESAKKTGHRIFVIGVGAAPAESVLINLASETGGACEFVTENENIADGIVRMFHRMRGKSAKNIKIDWSEKPIWQSELPKFIYDGETVHSFALFDRKPNCRPSLSWVAGDEKYSSPIPVVNETDDIALVRLGRKCQMEEIATKKEKIALGLKYQLVSDLTALILVYERLQGNKVEGLTKIQQVPQMPAYGHGNYIECFLDDGLISSNFVDAHGIFSTHHSGILPLMPNMQNLHTLYDKLIEIWKEKILQIDSLEDFINFIKQDKKFVTIKSKVKFIANQINLPEEKVWANLLAFLLEEKGILEMHDKRLLKSFLCSGAEKEKYEQAFRTANLVLNAPIVVAGL